MGETYYDVLGVESDATREEIRSAYRERVLETHPDHNDAPDAAEQFDRVSTAESVLTDGAERARYDRLGHDSYVRLAGTTAGSSGPDDSSSPSRSTSSDGSPRTDASSDPDSEAETKSANESQSGSKTGGVRGGTARGRTQARDDRDRQRRRERRRARQRAAAWAAGGESTGDGGSGEGIGTGASAGAGTAATGARSATRAETGTTGATTGGDRTRAATRGRAAPDESNSSFRYAVHDWDGEVELEWEGRPLTYSSTTAIGCCWLLYPVFVASSLTSAFPLAANAIVTACTLGVIGYLLTKPRVAAALFGTWSVLFPFGLDRLETVSAGSMIGLLALAFAWVPFGYALVLWWALRP